MSVSPPQSVAYLMLILQQLGLKTAIIYVTRRTESTAWPPVQGNHYRYAHRAMDRAAMHQLAIRPPMSQRGYMNRRIDLLKSKLNCSESLLAGMLEVTTSTLLNAERNFERLLTLQSVVMTGLRCGVPQNLLINFLHENLIENDEDSGTLIGRITSDESRVECEHYAETISSRFRS